jgi:hypothetical protein
VLTNYSATGAPYYSSLGAEYVEPVDELIDMAQQLSRRVNKNLAEMHLPRQVGALIDSLQGNPDPERMQSLMNDTTNAQAVKAAVDSGANSGGSSNGGGFSALALFSSSGADEAEDDLPMMAVMDDDDDEEEGDDEEDDEEEEEGEDDEEEEGEEEEGDEDGDEDEDGEEFQDEYGDGDEVEFPVGVLEKVGLFKSNPAVDPQL